MALNELGSNEDVLNELQSGRTRELLLLLQDTPAIEVIDPLDIQPGLSDGVITDSNGDYILSNPYGVIDDFEDGSLSNVANGNWSEWSGDTGAYTVQSSTALEGSYSVEVNTSADISTSNASNLAFDEFKVDVEWDPTNLSGGSDDVGFVLYSGGVKVLNASLAGSAFAQSPIGTDIGGYPASRTHVKFRIYNVDFDNNNYDIEVIDQSNGSTVASATGKNFLNGVNGVNKVELTSRQSDATAYFDIPTMSGTFDPNSGFVTDKLAAPTTPPGNIKQWNAIRAEDVTTGGSTSAEPVEFEILDSTDTALNSSRIPKSEIADTAFKLRNREYHETASAGQTQFTIPTTGDGGHYGIPILSVVTVEKNGSVLDRAWSFDGDDTITLDSGASAGDTITVSYDFDVFDNTLQPRAYLSREGGSETSPSISHFRYEYVI